MEHAERKIHAITLMKKLGIYKPYIKGYEEQDMVCFFENFAGFWVFQEPDVEQKMKEIEAQFNCTVYGITHEYTEFGECYDFLLVTRYEEEWDRLLVKEDDIYYAFAYVWNKTCDDFSELGTIGLRSFGGGIARFY